MDEFEIVKYLKYESLSLIDLRLTEFSVGEAEEAKHVEVPVADLLELTYLVFALGGREAVFDSVVGLTCDLLTSGGFKVVTGPNSGFEFK